MPPNGRRMWRARTRRKRLLVAIPGHEHGGAERYAVRIANAAAGSWDVAAAVRPGDAASALRRDLAAGGVRTLQMVRGERLRGLAGFVAMIELYRPDVVHLTLPWPLLASELRAACALLAVPTVVVHQLVPDAAELHVEHGWLYRRSRARRQTWVAVSQHGKRMLLRAFALGDDAELPVIYNAASGPGPGKRPPTSDARETFRLSREDQVIVSVGRLSHEKGHDLLVEAAAQLISRLPHLRILIAGEGKARASLEHCTLKAGLQDHVRLLGQVENVDLLLRSADLFAFPSRLEGTPFALLEAMGHGLPVIATDFGGVDEIIESGVNGVIVPQNDARQLAIAIERALGDTSAARRMGDRAREIASQFSERTMLSATMSLLEASARGSA